MTKAKSVKGASPAAKRAAKKTTAPKTPEITADDLALLDEAAEEEVVGEINLEALEADIAKDDAKKASYESQEAEKAEAPVVAAEVKKGGKRRNLTGVKPSERLNSAFPEAADLTAALTFHTDDGAIDTAAVLASADTLAKKVGEKFVNTIVNRERPDSMSVFTRLAIKALVADGSIESTALVDLYKNCTENKGAGYGVGTARSQASQMVNLLPALRIATRVGKTLELDKGSLIIKQIQATS